MDREHLKRVLEALIFASATPLPIKQMAAILPDLEHTEIESALTELASDLSDRAIYLKKAGGGYQFGTRPEYAEWIGQMFEEKQNSRLSRAALETLAIIAFKQPISRVEVGAIRGVNSDGVMKKLLDFRLITIAGRDNGPGRPLLFKTTQEFLNYFGINDVSELPRPKEVEELLADGEGGEILRDIPDEVLIAEGATVSAEHDEDENSDEDEESLDMFDETDGNNDSPDEDEGDDGEIDDHAVDVEDDSESGDDDNDDLETADENADDIYEEEKEQ